jgi:hypothetical protein
MAQTTSFVIANDSGLAVRVRINEVLAALQSMNAGTSAPTVTVAGMLWMDLGATPPVLRRRNVTDSDWDVMLDTAGNLAGLTSKATARSNLGLGTMATKAASSYDATIAEKASLSGATFTGTVTAPNFVSSSDVRLKSDIETIGEALDILQHLRGVRYTSEGRRQIGVIAQETEPHLPEVVFETEDGIKRVAYGNITGLLIEAIKDLSARIIQLETEKRDEQP